MLKEQVIFERFLELYLKFLVVKCAKSLLFHPLDVLQRCWLVKTQSKHAH